MELYKQAKSYQASAASRTEKATSFQRMSKSAADDIANLTKQLRSPADLDVDPVTCSRVASETHWVTLRFLHLRDTFLVKRVAEAG